MTILASIQARTGSIRLPGKVLKTIAGQPMLQRQINRILKSDYIDKLVVATSVNKNDDVIADLCSKLGIECFRGSEEDVLSRIARLLEEYPYENHAEFYGDSPLISPEVIDGIAAKFLEKGAKWDCVCNSLATTFPPGQEVIIYRSELLLDADRKVSHTDPLREHCGIHVTTDKSLNVLNIEAPAEYHYPELYMEVDTEKDFVVVSKVFEYFFEAGKEDFTLSDIIGFFTTYPELAALNSEEIRHWKSFRN